MPVNNTGKLILLIEDNEKITNGNRRFLDRKGYKTAVAQTLSEGRIAIKTNRPDAIILDIMLPDGSGLDFMRELRESENSNIPILLLTGLATQDDVVKGLTEGADDYLTKPYDFPVFLARFEALLRRAERVPEILAKGRLTFDITANIVMLDGINLHLTQKEFALILIFVQNEDRFIKGKYLYEKVWNTPMGNDTNSLKNTLTRLRSKIKNSGYCISWARGEGYCFERE